MKKILAASVMLAAFVVAPGVALAHLTHSQAVAYGKAYTHVARVFGLGVAGCRLIGPHATCRHSSDRAVVASTATLRRFFAAPTPAPPPQPIVAPAAAPVTTTVASVPAPANPTPPVSSGYGGGCGGTTPYAGGGQCWAIPYSVVQCESGGQNVPNSQGSGAQGYYQLMVGGGGSRAAQDSAAARLWAGGAGAGNWTCAGR